MADFIEGHVTRKLAEQEAMQEDAKKWRALVSTGEAAYPHGFTWAIARMVEEMKAGDPDLGGFEVTCHDGSKVKMTFTTAERAAEIAAKRKKAAEKAKATKARRPVIVVGRSQ